MPAAFIGTARLSRSLRRQSHENAKDSPIFAGARDVRVRFADFIIDDTTRTLVRVGDDVHLTPKAFDVLALLIAERPAVLTKEQLLERVWRGVTVSDASLNVLIGEIRKALGDDATRQAFIRTANRVGYAFCATATTLQAQVAERPVDGRGSCRVTWQSTTVSLLDGDNILGRSQRCRLVVDEETVSRQHAIIRVDNAARVAVLIDNDSLNGTFRNRAKVTEPVELADGDVIRLGSARVALRLWADGTTRTRRQVKGK